MQSHRQDLRRRGQRRVRLGMPLSWWVHLVTAAGACALTRAVWDAGGIFSPQLIWLMVLPWLPFYVLGRRAGLAWLCLVVVLQVALALASERGLVPPFALGPEQAMSSWASFSLVACLWITVMLMRDRLHGKALKKSQSICSELQAQRLALEGALQMREHFITTVSHELRTPMYAILGFNALLLSQAKDRPEALKVLEHTRQSADHLMTVIDDLFDHAQLQTGQLEIRPETFDLRRATEQAFELFKPRVDGLALDYRIEMDASLPTWVHTDRHRLMQVLVNLLGNALKFTAQGSVVLRVQWQDPGVLFSVQDTGIGIPHARQADIFKRFSQAEDNTQARYGGNGLGLAISQKLAHLLDGEIGFESEPGQGSRFWLRLPLGPASAPAWVKSDPPIDVQTDETPWRFLVVDDHSVNRLLTRQVLLSAWPHSTVLEAVNGQQALDLLQTEAVDLVLMDMLMPVMDGIAATAALRRDPHPSVSQLPVLGLTANATPQDLARFEAAGLNGVMRLPLAPVALCAHLAPWLRHPH